MFQDSRKTVRIISHTVPNITFLSLLANPFQFQLHNDSDVADYRRMTAFQLKYLR